jgi:hypothetical protein
MDKTYFLKFDVNDSVIIPSSSGIILTLSDPMSDLVRHYDFPVPDAFLDL